MAVINGAIDSGLDIIVTAVVLIVGRYSRRKAIRIILMVMKI